MTTVDAGPAPRTSRRTVPTIELHHEAITPFGHAEAVKASFDQGITRPLEWRKQQLEALGRLLAERGTDIAAAVAADVGKPELESYLTEIASVRSEVKDALRQLRAWTRPRRAAVPPLLGLASGQIVRDPLGTVLIIAPWNYPVNLALMPLVGAIAAGNAVILKPSELAPQTSAALARFMPTYLDRRAVRVVEGGVEEVTELLSFAWDHIFYTGSGHVGRIVLEAAAKHLTPVTLELGGKSPVYIDETADLDGVASWLAWGKYLNAGQTCVAPDYVLTTPAIAQRLVPALRRAIGDMYGADPQRSPDFGRMVNDRQLQRVVGLLGAGSIAIGGDSDPADRYLAPTVLTDVSLDDPVMQQEIFGPVLPIVTVSDQDEAISVITQRDKPLALYVFSTSAGTRDAFTTRTSSGSLVFNAVIMQLTAPQLPFGGVGASGMGAYHGERSITTFSHEKAVLRLNGTKPGKLLSWGMPPFTAAKTRMLRGSMK